MRSTSKVKPLISYFLSGVMRRQPHFFAKTIARNGWPDKIVIDKSGSNAAGLFNLNCLLVMKSWCWLIDVLQVKYLNNIIEQDHRFIRGPHGHANL